MPLQYLDTEKETLPVPDTQRILAKKEQKNVILFSNKMLRKFVIV